MAELPSILIEQVRRYGLDAAEVVSASSLRSTADLIGLVEGLAGADPAVLSTCRNGVYRSSMAASALSAAGFRVVSGGTHSGLSYEFTLGQLQQGEAASGGGVRLPAFTQPINLLILCSNGDSADELKEIQGILSRLRFFVCESGVSEFALLVLAGPEEKHTYY